MSYQIIPGDCLPTLRGMEESSIDLIATDPPYGISFMGKEWDKALPDPAIWRECLRVLKPGASAVVMSGSRLDCLWRMCRYLEEAGFELSQTALYWCYRSGFPKGGDLSKMADARAGAEREVVGTFPKWVPTPDERSSEAGCAFGKTEKGSQKILSGPVTDLARSLDGWFTKGKVKPAVEVIIWARKPISEKTELDNMIRWGVGGVNCGACMVPFESDADYTDAKGGGTRSVVSGWKWEPGVTEERAPNPAGRYPANLLVTDNAAGAGSKYFSVDAWAAEHGFDEDGWVEAAEAGVLQIPKPSKAEKNAGCDGLEQTKATVTMALVKQCANCGGKTVKSGGLACGCDSPKAVLVKQEEQPRGNPHPTCKPVRLFAYLCDFLCPPAGTVLDPFCGSGTTGVAALQTGRNFIGCELEAEYVAIAEARLAHAASIPPPAPKPTQTTLFPL